MYTGVTATCRVPYTYFRVYDSIVLGWSNSSAVDVPLNNSQPHESIVLECHRSVSVVPGFVSWSFHLCCAEFQKKNHGGIATRREHIVLLSERYLDYYIRGAVYSLWLHRLSETFPQSHSRFTNLNKIMSFITIHPWVLFLSFYLLSQFHAPEIVVSQESYSRLF
jgi:hypothetical protein